MVERIKREILKYFPVEMRDAILSSKIELNELREIRVRVNKPLILKGNNLEILVGSSEKPYLVSKEAVLRIFEMICGNSVYAFQDDIANGFITIFGGHRVGITGKALYRNEKIYSMKDISSLNFRVARQVIGAADKIVPQITRNEEFCSTLIIAPPGLGKTTVLRDLIRQISNSGKDVGVVDERSEIAATYQGICQNDLGIRTDVVDAISKADGMKMLVRSMRPDFIATDEIGTDSDAEAILYAVNSGVKIIATAHGESMADLNRSKKINELINKNIFQKFVFLEKTGIKVLENL